jgi:hypothetical protein
MDFFFCADAKDGVNNNVLCPNLVNFSTPTWGVRKDWLNTSRDCRGKLMPA